MGLPDQWDTCSRTMMFEAKLTTSAHWGDIIAIGLGNDVVLFDAITGITTSVFCGHTNLIRSLAFSQDGKLLMSKSSDWTVRVWDIQTGGVIRTFDHHPLIYSPASISSDGVMVAFGTDDGIVRLCDVRTGEWSSIKIYPVSEVTAIEFSPINSRHFISLSEGGILRQWDIDGDQIGPSYHQAGYAYHLAWTRDGTRFVSYGGKVATVWDAESGAVVVKLGAPDESSSLNLACFSPDGRFVACAADTTIWVWDITISGARLVGHLTGHSSTIKIFAFSSSLISGGLDHTIKFWKSSNFSMDQTTADQIAARGSFPEIRSIKLFAEEGMVVTSDADGVVKVWDVTTGRCKSSFSTPAEGERDTHLARNTLIIVWSPYADMGMDEDMYWERDRGRDWDEDEDMCSERGWDRDWDRDMGLEYHIWDVYQGQLLRKRKFHSSLPYLRGLKISGDGSKIFGLSHRCIAAVSMRTGEEVGHVECRSWKGDGFFVRGSKVGAYGRRWDFGGPGVPPFEEFPDGPHLELVGAVRYITLAPCWMEDTVTKRQVFCSLKKYLDGGRMLEWDGRYLLNYSPSGEVIMIIDFDPVCP